VEVDRRVGDVAVELRAAVLEEVEPEEVDTSMDDELDDRARLDKDPIA
jgi:hypothetical protein